MLELTNLVFIKKIGTGAFGKVYLVSIKNQESVRFAIKILNKRKLLKMRQADQLENEIKALKGVNGHVFIAKLVSVVRDSKIIGIVMDYISGGELFYWLRRLRKFSEYATLFYASEILVALEFIHKRGLLYRDLKPENILLTPCGHIKLTDFGFAVDHKEKTHIISGTPEYMSPEKLLNEDDGIESDYWSFGIILFEMFTGDPPFYDSDNHLIYRKILENDIYIPQYLSYAAADLLSRLLRKKRQERLGYWGLDDIKRHIFFSAVDWNHVVDCSLIPPIKPSMYKSSDYGYIPDDNNQDENEDQVPKKPYEYIKFYE
ncbi:cAMP-dependent protein kinase catalytic subunit [Vairimorpha necatrix]|uniref:cAMP-dependent protein kinase n=1 Tax=Vairimorpha necatrix TaxID=6039 RepID=A0AAX4JB29_9MICR